VARSLSLDPVQQINQFAVGNVLPDLTIVLDVPTRVSLARIQQRASDLPNRMERENIDFYKKVREGYLVLARSMPKRFFVVDGTLPEKKGPQAHLGPKCAGGSASDRPWSGWLLCAHVHRLLARIARRHPGGGGDRKSAPAGPAGHSLLLHGDDLETLALVAHAIADRLLNESPDTQQYFRPNSTRIASRCARPARCGRSAPRPRAS
jgi:hypothetical protein